MYLIAGVIFVHAYVGAYNPLEHSSFPLSPNRGTH
uniref:Uncharacterized protein n=1 Tax=Lepeophtheirus salmonis TaxID=72036 RepID=A0A0K2T712_LEPSM